LIPTNVTNHFSINFKSRKTMKSVFKLAMLPLLALALATASCKKDEPTPPPPTVDPYKDLYKIGDADLATAGLTLALYMDEEPFAGYNRVYAVVKDKVTNLVLENATVTFAPLMDMGAMTHSAPFEQPTWNAEAKAQKGAVTFIMPSTNGTWYLTVKATNPTTLVEEDHQFTFEVIAKTESRIYSFVSAFDGTTKVFVALVEPPKWKTGMNDFEVVVYKKASMMSFPAMTDLQIEIDPEMPTMGHGSPNNVNPVHMANGHYKGQVNFTMTGYWKVNMVVKDANGNVMNDQGFFDITFTNIF